MKPADITGTTDEKAKAKLTAKAKKILRNTDGLRVLKPGTVGYIVALSAVEAALGEVSAPAPAIPAGEKVSLVGYGHVTTLGKFVTEGTEADVHLEPPSAYPNGPVEGDWMFPVYMGHPAAELLHAARQAAANAPVVDLTCISMRHITVAVMDTVTKETPDDVVSALSAACGRVRRMLVERLQSSDDEVPMMVCPDCEGSQRISASEWCERCHRSGIIPARAEPVAPSNG